ncbi:MAG: branched-chain amino acid ABC transporter permease [Tissierellia bacterium]|jgi:branched-chain amino acid transport system permease protein|nr:branched-chain amino acid ABC transporter permease [Bacillota bacterium]NLK58704.1 branched-chain amino acid ABC transporter permease [Tissierellia bacterium]
MLAENTKSNIKQNRIYSIIALLFIAALLLFLELNRSRFSWGGMAVTVIQKSLIFAVVAVSMNLLNGFTGLFSLGQAGFMAIGAYVTAILTIPLDRVDGVYYMNGMAPWLKGFKEILSVLPEPLLIIVAMLIGGIIAGIFAFLIGIPVLRLKSDYLAIATLGFSEITRAILSAPQMDTITNGSYGLKNIPGLAITGTNLPQGTGALLIPFLFAVVAIGFVILVINSGYGRAFKAIREDEVAAEAMGINLLKHKEMSFVISSFITALAGGMLAMFMRSIEARTFSIMLTYDILLIVVIGGLGSVTGSIVGAFVVTFAKDWILRFFDTPLVIGGFQVPLLRIGFRMVVFSLLLMIVVLFYRRGLLGNREFSWDGVRRLFAGRFGKKPVPDIMDKDPEPMYKQPLIPDPPAGEPGEEESHDDTNA